MVDRLRAKNVRVWRRPELDPALSFEKFLPGPGGGPGARWVAALLTPLLPSSKAFGADFRFGYCDTWMSPISVVGAPRVHGPRPPCSGVCSSVAKQGRPNKGEEGGEIRIRGVCGSCQKRRARGRAERTRRQALFSRRVALNWLNIQPWKKKNAVVSTNCTLIVYLCNTNIC